jgi:hypothetical protein
MTSWVKVVTDPLGLAGFALFLVFSFLGKRRQGKKPSWLTPLAVAMAFLALVGGISLAFMRVGRPPAASGEHKIGTIQQSANGGSSSNIAGVQGNVSVVVAPPSSDNRQPVGPLTEEELIALLGSKVSVEKILAEIESRGVAFRANPDSVKKLRAAGASQTIVDSLEKNRKQ